MLDLGHQPLARHPPVPDQITLPWADDSLPFSEHAFPTN